MKTKLLTLIPAFLLVLGFLLGALVLTAPADGAFGGADGFGVENAPFMKIFPNNLLMCMLFVAGCGILSSVMALMQGISFGCLFGLWLTMQNSAADFAMLFLPHAVFEFAAMVIASGIGFKILRYLVSSEKQDLFSFAKKLVPGLFTVTACVLVGAIVESFITPMLYKLTC